MSSGTDCRRLAEPSAVPPEKRLACIPELAGGWINPRDLCPSCARQFMAALDGIDGPLSWHPDYTARAGVEVPRG